MHGGAGTRRTSDGSASFRTYTKRTPMRPFTAPNEKAKLANGQTNSRLIATAIVGMHFQAKD